MAAKTHVPKACVAAFSAATILLGCGAPHEAAQVHVPVVTDNSHLEPVTNDLGYRVEVTEARLMIQQLSFAVAGELLTQNVIVDIYDWAIPSAAAHPGHYEGGDITGELDGRHLLDWLPGSSTEVGTATLLEGTYRSANFILTRATKEDGLDPDDDLLNYSAVLGGTASRKGKEVKFVASVEIAEDVLVSGVPFEYVLAEDGPTALRLQLRTFDEIEGDTLFDGIDFFDLDRGDDDVSRIVPGVGSKATMDAHIALSQALQTHDNYLITGQ